MNMTHASSFARSLACGDPSSLEPLSRLLRIPIQQVRRHLIHGSLIETVTGVTVSLVPLTALMQQFMSRSDLIKDSRVSFEGMTRVQMDICVRLYAQAYHRYTSLSLDSVTARQRFIKQACAPCGNCETCSTDPVFAVKQCRAIHHEGTRCLQLARSRGYCVFHDPQLLSVGDPSSCAPCVAMTRSSVGCLNLFDTALLVRSDHYCGHCRVRSKCFSLLGNGLRHLVIHILDTDSDSDIYAAVNNVSPSCYRPVRAYTPGHVCGTASTGTGSVVSICAAMFCTNHTIGARFSLRYCSEFCFRSDNGRVSTRSGLVNDVSVVTPAHGPCDALAICRSQDATDTPQCSSVLQRVRPYVPHDSDQVRSATRHRVRPPRCFFEPISTSESDSDSDSHSEPPAESDMDPGSGQTIVSARTTKMPWRSTRPSVSRANEGCPCLEMDRVTSAWPLET